MIPLFIQLDQSNSYPSILEVPNDPVCPQRTVNLLGCGGTTVLCDALTHRDGPKHLQILDLANAEIGVRGAQSICDCLLHPDGPKHITSLQLGDNRLTDEGAKCILEALSRPDGPQHITYLGLKGNLANGKTLRAVKQLLEDIQNSGAASEQETPLRPRKAHRTS